MGSLLVWVVTTLLQWTGDAAVALVPWTYRLVVMAIRTLFHLLSIPPLWVTLPTILSVLFYIYSTWTFSTFRRLGVPGPSPWPVLGTLTQVIQKGVLRTDLDNIATYGKLVGTFEGSTPTLLVADVTLLKQIMVKQFHTFQNRRGGGFQDYPMRKILPNLRSSHWKHVRCLLTPSFSAFKLKHMACRINQCSEVMVRNMRTASTRRGHVNIKEYCGAFSMDVIAVTAFGLQIDSQNNSDDPFVRHAKKVFDFSVFNPAMLLLLVLPFAARLLRRFHISLNLFPKHTTSFFVDIINKAIKQRENNDQDTADFLGLMMEARVPDPSPNNHHVFSPADVVEGPDGFWSKKGLTHEEIVAQSMLFFLAGYETTATTLSFAAYSLATNPECQCRLLQEIDTLTEKQGEVTLEEVNRLMYLDMFLCETLRMFPPAVRVNRVCSRDVTIEGVRFEKGMVVTIPIYALHHDKQVWPEPHRFLPERFTAQGKRDRDPFHWMPFGMGPRQCIGVRLAIMEMKLALVHLLRHFRFEASGPTEIPLRMKKFGLLQPESPIMVRLVDRL